MSRSTSIPKRSVIIGNHRTSVSLETEYWLRLKAIAAARQVSINDLVSKIDAARDGDRANLSSALRSFVLEEMRKALQALAHQVEISGAVDDHGHDLKNLKALADARVLIQAEAA